MGLNDMFKNNQTNTISKVNTKAGNLTFVSDLSFGTKDGLEDAYEYLKECQENGVDACVGLQYKCDFYPTSPYRHKWLYARDITTLDNLYLQVYGLSKNECFKRKSELGATLRSRDVEYGLDTSAGVPQQIDQGLER